MIAEVYRRIAPVGNFPSMFRVVDQLEVSSPENMVEIMLEYSKDSFCSVEKVDPEIFFRVGDLYFSPCHMELVESNLGWCQFNQRRKKVSEYFKP